MPVMRARFIPGSPFYAQEREGRGGRTFRMWKLRTMHHDADALLERHLAEDPAAAAEWATKFKLARDPRILPGIGHCCARPASTSCRSCGTSCAAR
jgi:lipopolysaccharide/colanic/teichoic acid biosynthesis glycosyltransferase